MNYTEEEIILYIEILKSVDKSPSLKSHTVTCKNCHCPGFFLLIRDTTIAQIVF